jgi:hypothetical protein
LEAVVRGRVVRDVVFMVIMDTSIVTWHCPSSAVTGR